MSDCFSHLHSHSGIERKLLFSKDTVLIDKKYANLFPPAQAKSFSYNNVDYCKVPIKAFVWKGGVFKNFDK